MKNTKYGIVNTSKVVLTVAVDVPQNKCRSDCANRVNVAPRSLQNNTRYNSRKPRQNLVMHTTLVEKNRNNLRFRLDGFKSFEPRDVP